MKYDVVIVGGGPAGALAARASASAGAKTLVLERAENRVPCCAGLVSLATAERLHVPSRQVLREIHGVRVVSPKGKTVELRAGSPKAVVLDRKALDRFLREKAEDEGAEIRWISAKGLHGTTLLTDRGSLEFTVLVGADGAMSAVARWAGLPRPREILVAAQAEVRAELGDMVEVHLGVVPDFFAWVVPADEGLVRVGLATAAGCTAWPRLKEFLNRRFPQSRVLSLRTGLIPLGRPGEITRDRVVLVGNAAGQTKPLTGGGLAFLSQCAPVAGELAARGPEALAQYPARCRALLGEEEEFEEQARRVFCRLSPEALEEIVRILTHPHLQELLAKAGDIDRFSSLRTELLRNPRVWPLLLPLARWFV